MHTDSAFLDHYEERAESFATEMSREYYLVGAGLKASLEVSPIFERYPDLVERSSVDRLLAARDERRALYLAESATLRHLRALVKGIDEQVTNDMLRAKLTWDGRQVAYQDVPSLVANEPDWARRHALNREHAKVAERWNGRLEERLEQLHSRARELGFSGYIELVEQLRGLDLDWLKVQMEGLLDKTENVYFDALPRFLDKLGVPRDEADASDLARLFRGVEFDPIFPGMGMVDSLRQTLAGMRIDLDRQPGLELDIEPRALKSPRAFCSAIRVPDEVKLVIKPKGGQDDYRALFHEAGHALHFSNTSGELPYAYRYEGDNSVTESYAFLFDNLTHDPEWLGVVLGYGDASQYLSAAHFHKLWYLRRYGSKLLYELELHADGSSARERYVKLLGTNLGVRIDAERYLSDVDDFFYSAQYLRAWILEVQLRTALRDRYGSRWFTSPQAGDLLLELWSWGQEFSASEMARRIGYDGLDAQPLVDELSAKLWGEKMVVAV
jgi:hypothetical protein